MHFLLVRSLTRSTELLPSKAYSTDVFHYLRFDAHVGHPCHWRLGICALTADVSYKVAYTPPFLRLPWKR